MKAGHHQDVCEHCRRRLLSPSRPLPCCAVTGCAADAEEGSALCRLAYTQLRHACGCAKNDTNDDCQHTGNALLSALAEAVAAATRRTGRWLFWRQVLEAWHMAVDSRHGLRYSNHTC